MNVCTSSCCAAEEWTLRAVTLCQFVVKLPILPLRKHEAVYLHIRAHSHTHIICTHSHTQIQTQAHTDIHTYTHAHKYAHIHKHTHTHICTHTHTNTHTSTHAHILSGALCCGLLQRQTHIHTRTHTDTHTYAHKQPHMYTHPPACRCLVLRPTTVPKTFLAPTGSGLGCRTRKCLPLSLSPVWGRCVCVS
jgi:hypothetical protein